MNRSKPIATILCASLLALFWGLPHRTRSCPPGLPQVYLLATDPTASEVGPDPGKFRVYRNGGDTSVPLVVYFLQPHGGTAQNGTDYQTLPEYAIIPADSNSVEVLVTPILDANCNEGNETVILTLATNANYWLAWPTNATVTLADVPPNSDNDGDNMLDCWELQHFGNLGQTAGGDYDRDGVNNVDEFNAGTDPNDIWFDTQIESPYVNQRLLQGACVVHGGVPHQMAVLVNSTNLTSVTWSNYTPNFSAWLPDADGSHTVLVALRGRTTQFAPVTDETEVTLDRVPPLLVITNPVTETVSKPFLQVQGYANEPLGAMHYDLTNTAGCFSNGLMVVLEQEFDTNAFDFTTNYFQAFDLELTNGLNQIVLTMSDRAGNVVTTNLAVTLDYTSATNPPLLELLWPTNGAHLSGTNFYVRGRISDETARLRALWVDTSGATNEVEGIVERNGLFWVENLPVEAATNGLTLIAEDAAGNSGTTNLTVVKSDVELTIDSVPEGEALYNSSGTVSGRVSNPNCSVTVNGVAATVDASGNWTAQNVPIRGRGTATFDAVASVGGIGPGIRTSVQKERPPMILATMHTCAKATYANDGVGHWSRFSWGKGFAANLTPGEDGAWIWATRGTAKELRSHNDGWYKYIYIWTTAFQQTYYSDSTGYEYTIEGIAADQFSAITGVPDKDVAVLGSPRWVPPIFVHHFFAKGVRYVWPWAAGLMDTSVGAKTELKLYTGGKGIVGRKNLFCIIAWAESYGKPPRANPHAPWMDTPITPVSPSSIQLLGKTLGHDGRLWLTLPDDAAMNLNVRVPGRHYGAWAYPEKYRPYIMAKDIPLEENTPEFCVGQKVTFSSAWDYRYPYSGTPPGIRSNYCDWVASPKHVNTNWYRTMTFIDDHGVKFTISYGAPQYANNPDLWRIEQPHAWWYSGGPKNVGLNLTVYFENGQSVSWTASTRIRGRFRVFRPRVTMVNTAVWGPPQNRWLTQPPWTWY